MRTDEEIKARIEVIKKEDFFGFSIGDLLLRLTREQAKEIVGSSLEGETDDSWSTLPRDRASILVEMGKYMTFAWEKVLDHRGLSATRSVQHYKAWIWLLGDEDFAAIDWDRYPNYGAPVLLQICDRFGIGRPTSAELLNMAEGEPCRVDCKEGCGQ